VTERALRAVDGGGEEVQEHGGDLPDATSLTAVNVSPIDVTCKRVGILPCVSSDTEDDDLTIDELARRTGMTVRNVRAHQSRGRLARPTLRGRTGE
jgi:hypothetical protein